MLSGIARLAPSGAGERKQEFKGRTLEFDGQQVKIGVE
jgi:hypothetical protein